VVNGYTSALLLAEMLYRAGRPIKIIQPSSRLHQTKTKTISDTACAFLEVLVLPLYTFAPHRTAPRLVFSSINPPHHHTLTSPTTPPPATISRNGGSATSSKNWVAFRAASGRVNQSSHQLTQAIANIPTNLATMSSKLEQLEHQPTNAMLAQQTQQMTQQLQKLQHQLTAM